MKRLANLTNQCVCKKEMCLLVVFLAVLMGLLPLRVVAQEYTVDKSETAMPTEGKLTAGSDTWIPSTDDKSTWIKMTGKVNSGKVRFYAIKNSGSFNNTVTISLRKDVKINGSKVTSKGTEVGNNTIEKDKSTGSVTITPDFSSGSHTYRFIVESGSLIFYTAPITVTAKNSSSTPNLSITSTTYFGTSTLTVGKSANFSTKIKNNGSTSWTGYFFVKPVGTKNNWIPSGNVSELVTIKSGGTYTLTGTYTPDEAGSYTIGVYYLTQGESTGAQVGSSFNITVNASSNTYTEIADMVIARLGFNTDEFTVGQSYHYKVGIKYRGTSDWKGTFFLKDENGEEIYRWPVYANSPLTRNSGTYFECDYTPKATGKKSFTIYYQTNYTGKGREVPAGTLTNPQNITIVAAPVAYTGLKLNTAITSPSTLGLGETGNIAASVVNNGNSNWDGVIYIADNGAYIERKEVSIKKGGGLATITKTGWKPTKAGSHEISVLYKANSTGAEDALVAANGFNNPIVVTVKNNNTATKAKLTLVTKGLAPTRVSPGTEVYYNYRITDEKGNRLSGVKVLFEYKLDGILKSGYYVSPASDENGLITLGLKTEGDDAIAQKGQTATLTVKGLTNESGQNLDLYESTDVGYITLSVKNGRAFDNVQSLKVEIEPGLKWGTKIENDIITAKVGVAGSFPISVKMDYDDNGKVKKYTDAIGAKAEASGKIDIGFKESLDNPDNWFSKLSGDVSGGISVGGDIEFSSSDLLGGLKNLALAIVDRMTVTTFPKTNMAIRVIRNIYTGITKPSIETSWFVSFSAGGSVNVLSAFPEPKGIFKSVGTLPSKLGIDELGVGGNVTVKYVPTKKSVDLASGEDTWAGSVSVKCAGSANVKGSFENTLFKNKSWWKRSNFKKFYEKWHDKFFNFAEADVKKSIGITYKETDKYSDRNKSVLLSLSNELSLIHAKKISLDEFKLLQGWDLVDLEAAYSRTASVKMTSGGTWVKYLRNLANTNNETSENINNAYPTFKSKYLLTPPSLVYDVMRRDHLQNLSKIAVANSSQYNIKDVLKMEETHSSELSMDVAIPLMSWQGAKFTLGASVSTSCYPSESYLSIEDNEFLPVALRPSETILEVAKKVVTDLAHDMDEALKSDKGKLDKEWDRLSAKVGAGSNLGQEVYFTNVDIATAKSKPAHPSLYLADGNIAQWVKDKHPQLVQAEQNDICKFGFTINGQTQNFNAGINLGFEHFYPAGELLGITEQGDTLFVVSEVCNLSALDGSNALNCSQNGKFKLETSVGVDDLTPFGLPKDLALDVYYAEDGSDIWQYLGPAGTTIMVDKLGSYIMATSIKNDVQAPELDARYYEEAGYIRLIVKDNIGLRLKSLQVIVNGTPRTAMLVNEQNYIVPLTDDDRASMITFFANVTDLSGNDGHVFRLFNMDKNEDPTNIVNPAVSETTAPDIAFDNGRLIVSGCKPNVHVALFSISGHLMGEGKTDAFGCFSLSHAVDKGGVYIVTLSNGTTKKLYMK